MFEDQIGGLVLHNLQIKFVRQYFNNNNFSNSYTLFSFLVSMQIILNISWYLSVMYSETIKM